MKYILTIGIILIHFFSIAQTIEPTKTEALLYILIVDNEDKPMVESIYIDSKISGKKYSVKSNKDGIAELLVPKNASYKISMEYVKDYDVLDIPNTEFYTLNYKIIYDKKQYELSKLALININVHTEKDKPVSEDISLISSKTKSEFKAKTNDYGLAELRVPKNDSYVVNYRSAPNYDLITIPDADDYQLDYESVYEGSYDGAIYPSRDQALFNFKFIDLDSVPVKDEEFILENERTGQKFLTKTNENGESHLLVPIGETYMISATNYKNFVKKIIDKIPDLYQVDVILKFISSAEFTKRKEEQDKIIKEREIEWEKRKAKYEEFLLKSLSDTTEAILTSYLNFKPDMDTVISSVLNRNKYWKNKLIVMDVTGSMGPYINQVAMWYKLNYAEKDPIQFVLFNDGDNKPEYQKVIGKTGGIHYCKYCDVKTFGEKLKYSRNMGSGGDAPENDLEALIAATKNCENYTDIILVVDNYSPIKDIELLYKIKKPVKIILCGFYDYGVVNSDYLDLAYHTNGSIHTIEQDILDIGKTLEGTRIKIGKNTYVLTKSRFVRYKEE